jgi:hypothetical protein
LVLACERRASMQGDSPIGRVVHATDRTVTIQLLSEEN